MTPLKTDLRQGVRMMAKNVGFTSVAAITLALGIGANTAIFSVVNSVLLRPLNYPESDQLMTVWEDHTRRDGPHREGTSPPGYRDWRDQSSLFSHMAALSGWAPTLTEAGEPEMLVGGSVSSGSFGLLGVGPLLGREFKPDEDRIGAAKVTIISHSLWQRHFGGDPAILGKALRLSGEQYTVVGVMPAGFQFPIIGGSEIWRPWEPSLAPGCQRGCYTQQVLARLKPGVTAAQVRAELTSIGGRVEQQFPETNKNVGVTVTPLQEVLVSNARDGMLALLWAVGFVLLIACANVASLQLVQATARSRDLAVRAALGASRWQIMRQLLTESVLLASLGGGLGLLLGYGLVDALKQLAPAATPRIDEVSIDGRVLLFSIAGTLLTGLACGLIPAFQTTKPDLNRTLRESGAGHRGTGGGGRLRFVLVVAEIAVSVTLLIGAGLLVRSFARLQHVDPGFDPAPVLTARLGLPPEAYSSPQKIATFHHQLRDQLLALPGVQAAAFSSSVPMTGIDTDASFSIEGRVAPAADQRPVSWFGVVSPEYFETMNIHLRQGRVFAASDHETAPKVVIISEATARRFWPNQNPVGQRIGFGREKPDWREIIGVVADVRHFGLSLDSRPTMYFSTYQLSRGFTNIVLRVEGDPAKYAGMLRREVQALDKSLALSNVQTMEEVVSATIAVPRMLMLLFGGFAVVALLLAAIGIYGVMAYSVAQRRHEMGIRLALGAKAHDVMELVIGEGMKVALLGIALGVVVALGLTRLMQTLLFDVSATDPLTFMGMAVLLALVALLACWVPARRTTLVDPLVALRYE